jgi:hypothetical protein
MGLQRGQSGPKTVGGMVKCEIDGARSGSAFRFLNHSCDPNAALFVGRVGTDRRVKYVMAIRDIEEGEAVTIDYGWKWKASDLCYCGSESCRNPMETATNNDQTAKGPAKTVEAKSANAKRKRVVAISPASASSPVSNSNDEHFYIDRILERKMSKEPGHRRPEEYYLVRWQGYDPSYDCWVHGPRLREDAPDLVEAFDENFESESGEDSDEEYEARRPSKRCR